MLRILRGAFSRQFFFAFVLVAPAMTEQKTSSEITAERAQKFTTTGKTDIASRASRSGAVSINYDAKLQGLEYHGADFGVVVNVAGAASANCAAIDRALVAIDAQSGGRGGFLRLADGGDVYTSCPIDNRFKGITVGGWSRETMHDVGAVPCSVSVIPTFAGTVLKHRTPRGNNTTPVWTGGGFVDFCVHGNGLATRLLEVDSVRAGRYRLYLANSEGSEAAYFTSGTTGVDFGEAADIQHADVELFIRQLDTLNARNANGVVLTGTTTANFSANKVRVVSQIYNGRAIDVINADNNQIESRALILASGSNIRCRGNVGPFPGCVGNSFLLSGGPSYAEGTSDAGVTAGVSNYAYVDTGNGTPDPTAGAGSSWSIYRNASNTQGGFAHSKLAIADTVTAADKARKALTVESLRVYNESSAHQIMSDPLGNLWALRIDGASGALEFLRLGGSGATIKVPSLYVGANQVVAARQTGWGAPTGTLDRGALTTYAGQTVSARYVQAEAQATDNACKKVSQELGALITDLRAHGLIGN